MSDFAHLEFRTSRGTRYHLIGKPGTDENIPTWFFFHGFLGQAADWLPFIQHLPTGTSWYAVDLLGHGKSDRCITPESYAPDLLYRDIAEIWQHYAQAEKDIAVGYSMGGRQLLGACLAQKIRPGALILMGANFGLQTAEERATRQSIDDAWAVKLRNEPLDAFLEKWYQQPLLSRQPPSDPAQRQEWYRKRLDNHPLALAYCVQEFSPAKTPDFSLQTHALDMPVLLFSGEHDPRYVAHYKEIVEALPKGCHTVISGCGHTLPVENPEETCRQCLKLLNSHLQ